MTVHELICYVLAVQHDLDDLLTVGYTHRKRRLRKPVNAEMITRCAVKRDRFTVSVCADGTETEITALFWGVVEAVVSSAKAVRAQ